MPRKKKPTRIALISDIHGNLPALEAVLDDAGRAGYDEIWNLGDMLGYAPFPNEVLQTLRQIEAVNVIGNYDQKVLAFGRKQAKWKRKKPPAKYAAFEWNHAHLRASKARFLNSLPEQIRCKAGGLNMLLVHGSPLSIDEPLGSLTPGGRLGELAEAADADAVLCGHSHDPFLRRVALTWFVNPGSVGRPEGGDWQASYAILECSGGELRVDHRRVEYDIARVVRAVHAAGLPREFVDVFRKAKSLDQLATERRHPGTRCKSTSGRQLDAVMMLARSCQYEREHTHHVTKLALDLFDGLKGLHRMGPHERFQLQCGALLHDIGWTEGRQGHHRTAMKRILSDPLLPFAPRQREIIALVARYHRKALPQAKDKYFASLTPADQHRVEVLAGFLRVADGLDRSHAGVVRRLLCRVSPRQVTVSCHVNSPADAEFITAKRKADLVERVFGRPWVFQSLPRPMERS